MRENPGPGNRVGMTSYISKMFWTSLRSKSSGTMVYRGYTAARNASNTKTASADTPRAHSRRGSNTSVKSTKSAGVDGDKNGSSSRKQSGVGERPKGLDGGRGTRLDDVFKTDRDHRLERVTSRTSEGEIPAPRDSKDLKDLKDGKEGTDGKGSGIEEIREGIKVAGKDIADKLQSGTGIRSEEGLREEQVPIEPEKEGDTECTDLILVIHGIGELVGGSATQSLAHAYVVGQQLATQYEGFNFVYAANVLRQVMRQVRLILAQGILWR
jgi:hypothetical protein